MRDPITHPAQTEHEKIPIRRANHTPAGNADQFMHLLSAIHSRTSTLHEDIQHDVAKGEPREGGMSPELPTDQPFSLGDFLAPGGYWEITLAADDKIDVGVEKEWTPNENVERRGEGPDVKAPVFPRRKSQEGSLFKHLVNPKAGIPYQQLETLSTCAGLKPVPDETGGDDAIKKDLAHPSQKDAATPDLSQTPPAVILEDVQSKHMTACEEITPAMQIIAELSRDVAMDKVPSSRAGEIKSFRMHLRPEHLGDVEVTLRHTGQETSIHISVSTEAVAEVLRHDASLLRDQLAPVLGPASSRGFTISVQVESHLQGLAGGGQSGTTSQGGSFGSQSEARGRGSSSGKDDMPIVRRRSTSDDKISSLYHSASGLVV